MAKILCIEDEPAVQMLLALELEDCGHQTVKAGNGKEGLDVLGAERPDLVLCDIMMPVMDGMAFLRSLREQGFTAGQVPVIMVSAALDPQTIQDAKDLGAAGVLSKPIDFDRLCETVEGYLEGAKS